MGPSRFRLRVRQRPGLVLFPSVPLLLTAASTGMMRGPYGGAALFLWVHASRSPRVSAHSGAPAAAGQEARRRQLTHKQPTYEARDLKRQNPSSRLSRTSLRLDPELRIIGYHSSASSPRKAERCFGRLSFSREDLRPEIGRPRACSSIGPVGMLFAFYD
jgi:hypothetical protein